MSTNPPKPLVLTPPGAPEGEAFVEIKLDYPDDVKLVMSSHKNGVRIYAEQLVDEHPPPAPVTGPQAEAPHPQPAKVPGLLVDLILPWDAWYKIRRSLFNEKS